jgi:anti-anti-sigma factor
MTAAHSFAFTTRTAGSNEIVELSGELDIAGAPQLRSHLRVIVRDRDPERLVLDLAGLDFIDSSGLAVLVWAHRSLSERGNLLCLVAPRPLVRKVLRITGLVDRLNVHPTIEAALSISRPFPTWAGDGDPQHGER